MLNKILIFAGVVLAGLIILIMIQPDEFRVTRTTIIHAPVKTVFAQISNQRKWEAWSPWAKLDPNAKFTYEGPDSGVGSIARWDGNNDVGSGSSTLTDLRDNEFLRFRLDFLRPMKSTSLTEFIFKADDANTTTVTWIMSGKNTFVSKAIGLVMNCEKMVGGQFEQGLMNLRSVVEPHN